MTTTYSLEDVQAMLPNGKNGEPPSVRSIKVKAKKLGALRKIGQVHFFINADLAKIAKHYWCDVPTVAQARAAESVLGWESYIYFICADDKVKIGTTNQLAGRVSELQTSNPHKLSLLGFMEGGPEDERKIHKKFQFDKFRGEWFEHSFEIDRFIGRRCITPYKLCKQAIGKVKKK